MIQVTVEWGDGTVATWVELDDVVDADGNDLGDRIEKVIGRHPDSIQT